MSLLSVVLLPVCEEAEPEEVEPEETEPKEAEPEEVEPKETEPEETEPDEVEAEVSEPDEVEFEVCEFEAFGSDDSLIELSDKLICVFELFAIWLTVSFSSNEKSMLEVSAVLTEMSAEF